MMMKYLCIFVLSVIASAPKNVACFSNSVSNSHSLRYDQIHRIVLHPMHLGLPMETRISSKLLASTSDDSNDSDTPIFPSLAMVCLPLASAIFPALLDLARSLPANSSVQFAAVTALFVSNRAYLYAMAATIVSLAALRGAADRPQLGQRITDLTEELLYRPSLDYTEEADSDAREKPSVIQSLSSSGLEESLDQMSTETQALVLPLLVSFLLALSVFLLPFWNGPTSGDSDLGVSDVQQLTAQYLPIVSQVWNVGLLALFSKAEIRRLGNEFGVASSTVIEWGVAAGITGVACFTQLWPAQNFVNMALAVLVARAIQLDKFYAIVGALGLLTIYDATSVFLIPAAGAVDVVSKTADIASSTLVSANPGAASSAMGSIAIQKLTSETFQPGLLVTKIGDQLGGGLGLGDAVFPSILATFVRRFDSDQDSSQRLSLFAVSIGGYLLGCFACEFAPLLSTTGLPALVFINPLMLGSVILVASISGELRDLWDFDPKKGS